MSTCPDRPRGRAGFTLIELMMALVLSGLLGTLVFQFIQGESRTVELQNARGAVLQNARGTIELLTGELRTVSALGIVAGDESSVTFRLPVAWGVYCELAGTSAELLYVADRESGPVIVHNRGTNSWAEAGSVSDLRDGDESAGEDCEEGMGVAHADAMVATVDPVAWGALEPGDEFYVYQTVTYELRPEDAETDWIYRIVDGDPQPVAGPVDSENGGLRFTYRDPAGNVVVNPTDPAGNVAQIEVQVRMRSRNLNLMGESRPWRDEATTVVHLRNRL